MSPNERPDTIERIWLTHYPPGVPAEIDPQRHRSLIEFFRHSVEKFGDLPAFSSFGKTLTYRDLDRHSHAIAAFLQSGLHLSEGDRIAVMMPNLLQYPIAIFGALRAGLVVVNVNPMYTARELAHQLNDSGARAILVLDSVAAALHECLKNTAIRHVLMTRVGDMLSFPKSTVLNLVSKYVRRGAPRPALPGSGTFLAALAAGQRLPFEPVDIGPDAPAFLQYTGGTTGPAKGAILTHRNLVANVEQAAAWLHPYLREAEEVIITALPLYHIFALTANCLTFMKLGGHSELIADPRDMPRFVRRLARTPFTAITGVNTLFNGLLSTPGFSKVDVSRLKVALAGGAALQESVARRWKQVTGTSIVEAYGLTEASPAVCINPLDLHDYNGCVGLPIPSTEVTIRDEAGRILPPDTVGELWVRGPQVMKGYWRQPQETAVVLSDDGWLRTGDIGVMNADGYIALLDRKKDMILVSGFNVYPNEVEDAIAELPAVREVGVFGVPDPRSGEAVAAVIVRGDPRLDSEAIRAHCRRLLTGYKRPTRIFFAKQLPKNTIGKILRRELRSRFADLAHSDDASN